MLTPILLRASPLEKANSFVIKPGKNDEKHHIKTLYRQSIHMPIYHLTKSEEVPINVAHYEVSNLFHCAAKVFITSSPIFTVHYEICPPGNKVEEFANPRLRNVADLLLNPATNCLAKISQTEWKSVKLTTAYGIHSAVQRVIVTEKIQNVKTFKKTQRQCQLVQIDSNYPLKHGCIIVDPNGNK